MQLADIAWVDPLHDLALLQLRGHPEDDQSPARWGYLIGSDPVPYKAIGFPSFTYYGSARGVEQLGGLISPLSLGVDGGYVLDQAASPEPDQHLGWAGASGAAVFCDDLIIGIVTKDDRAFASRRLHAARAYELFHNTNAMRILTQDLGHRPVLEPVELTPFLQPPSRSARAATPGSILAADIEAVRFTGRTKTLNKLVHWRDSSDRFSVRLITGDGGQGKTRLAQEFALRTRDEGWFAGFATTSVVQTRNEQPSTGRRLGSRLGKSNRPILVIVDYAETDPEFVADTIDEMLASTPHSNVRMLLLSRVAGPWWYNQVEALTTLDAEIIKLAPLTSSARERREAYQLAVKCIAEQIPLLSSSPTPGDRPADWHDIASQLALNMRDLSDNRLGNALTLHITALIDLLNVASGEVPKRLGKSTDSELVAHEFAYIRRAAVRRHLLDSGVISDRTDADDCAREAWRALERSLAAAILLGPCDPGQALDIGRIASRDRPTDISAWLTSLYPPPLGLQGIGSIQPDRLAELLLGRILVAQPDLLFQIATLANGIDKAISVLLILLHTAAHAQFGPVAEQARDLVAANDQFSRAAHILTFTIAEAASRHGDKHARSVLSVVEKKFRSIPEADQYDFVTVLKVYDRTDTFGEPRTYTRPSRRRGGLPSSFRDLTDTNPRVLRVLLNNAMTILGYQAQKRSAAGRREFVLGSAERPLAPQRTPGEDVALLYVEAYPALLDAAYRIVGADAAQDVVQSVFLSICAKRYRRGPVKRPLRYLRQMVVNSARSYVRSREREVCVDFVGVALAEDFWQWAYDHVGEPVAGYYASLAYDFSNDMDLDDIDPWELSRLATLSSGDYPELASMANMGRDALRVALRSLPADQQTAIRLHFYEGISIARVAAIMGTSTKVAARRIEHAIAALRTTLDT